MSYKVWAVCTDETHMLKAGDWPSHLSEVENDARWSWEVNDILPDTIHRVDGEFAGCGVVYGKFGRAGSKHGAIKAMRTYHASVCASPINEHGEGEA